MKPELAKYSDMKICAAVSGGRDSMALLHYLLMHAREYGITFSVINCDHKMRGEASARDSAFVKQWCKDNSVPLLSFEYSGKPLSNESEARAWRYGCYLKAVTRRALPSGGEWEGADAVATAHHLNDNAETVLFNLARGSALSGMTGIRDGEVNGVKIIHPLISCTRGEIEEYISANNVPYVDDETNFTPEYTRNKLRLSVLPELEKAVRGSAENIFRFSRIADEDEEYFNRIISERGLIAKTRYGYDIAFCGEKVIFRRAAVKVLTALKRKDYTSAQLATLYGLQFLENGKRFEFLGLSVCKDGGRLTVTQADGNDCAEEAPFCDYISGNLTIFGGKTLEFAFQSADFAGKKALKADLEKIPRSAVIRFMRQGDKFKKFGGGTKSLGDFFTDKKIRSDIRKRIPLIADGNEILAVCGVEISDKIKVTDETRKAVFIITEYGI